MGRTGGRAVFLLALLCLGARTAGAADEHAAGEHLTLGAKAFDEGDFARAVEELTASLAARPSLRAHMLRGDAEVQLSRVDEALADYGAALQMGPSPRQRATIERTMRDLATALKTRLAVSSDPPGAKVYVDLKAAGARGVTPLVLPVAPGRHRVFVELDGYEPFVARDVEVAGERETPLVVNLVVKGCDLRAEAAPAGATIALDGGPAQPSPLSVRVRGGEHTLAYARPGSQPRQRRVTCVIGTPLTLRETLDQIPPGRVVVAVPPPVELRVDGQARAGTTLALAPGDHTVRVEAAGREPWQVQLRVDSGQEIRLAPTLVAHARASRRAMVWLWAGVGVAVTGVAVGLGVGLALAGGSDTPSGRLGNVRIFALQGGAHAALPAGWAR